MISIYESPTIESVTDGGIPGYEVKVRTLVYFYAVIAVVFAAVLALIVKEENLEPR